MDYEKISSETDLSNDDEVTENYVSHRFRRGTSWIQRLIIAGLVTAVIAETTLLFKLAVRPRIRDPSLGLWC